MHVKVTPMGLSIPPLLSTTWKNILSLSAGEGELHVKLSDGSIVNIPNLSPNEIKLIFDRHERFLESSEELPAPKTFRLDIAPIDASGRVGFMAFDELGAIMQHNPEQSDLPHLPPQVIEKIGMLAQSLPGLDQMPEAVFNCNCMHCQITRALMGRPAENSAVPLIEENISDQELQFSEWVIKETEDKLYTVVSKLDPALEYHVFLGNPIGCTCGNNKCEHILAVLKS